MGMSHRTKLVTGAALAAALTLPAGSATGEPSPSDFRNAAKYCKELRTNSGSPDAFRSAVDEFASGKVTRKNAYGKCVSAQAREEQRERRSARRSAQRDCKAEREQNEDEFRAAHGGETFAEFYGTNRNNRNAFGRCVSQKTEENEQRTEREEKNELNSAKECKAEREQNEDEFKAAHGGETFAEFYGTNANNRNAFGKCVSTKAREKNDEQNLGA
jgi:hypothetical protein